MRSYYEILELTENAGIDQVRKAYRRLAMKYHPDHNNAADAKERFIEITEAYEVLTGSRKSKRKTYSTSVVTEQDLREAARERARAYAQMKYAEFRKKVNEYESTPMHRILWPKWVNYAIIVFCLLFITDSLLPKRQIKGQINDDNRRLEVKGFRFVQDENEISVNLTGYAAIVYVTPIIGFVHQYELLEESTGIKSPAFRQTDYIVIIYLLLTLALITLANRTVKFENKLLIKAGMVIFMLTYTLIYLSRYS